MEYWRDSLNHVLARALREGPHEQQAVRVGMRGAMAPVLGELPAVS